MRTEGIVYKSILYKEKQRITYLYTPNGKISIKSTINKKGERNEAFSFLGNINEFVSTNSNFPSLSEYNIIKDNFDLTKNISKLEILRIITLIINYIPDDTNHLRLYNFIKNILISLNEEDELKLLSIFLIKLSYIFGINPSFDFCCRCGRKDNLISFSINDGGALCTNCNNGEYISLDIFKEYYKDKKDFNLYSNTNFISLLHDLETYYNKHANINLKINYNVLKIN